MIKILQSMNLFLRSSLIYLLLASYLMGLFTRNSCMCFVAVSSKAGVP